jgi:hypothetical protein
MIDGIKKFSCLLQLNFFVCRLCSELDVKQICSLHSLF